MRSPCALALLWLLPALCHGTFNIQKPGITQSQLSKKRAEEVKGAFSAAFNDYIKFGFPSDEVRPVTKGGQNTRNGWSATLVDALDTLFVMDLQNEFNRGVAETLKVDFSKSHEAKQSVSVFETTIRYLAGMLSAYELSGSTNTALLRQAERLGEKLLIAWQNNHQTLPFPELNFTTNKPTSTDATTSAAQAGSLILEFDRLSFHTKKPQYLQLAAKAMKTIMNTPATFPGLPGFMFDVRNNTIVDDLMTWGASADSYMEYLLKYGMLSKNADTTYYNTWKLAVQSSIRNLVKVSPVNNLTYLADYSNSNQGFKYEFSHLGCFAGGNWLLGGRVLNEPLVFDYGLKLLQTCMETYKRTKTGLGPEVFRFLGPRGETSGSRKPTRTELDFFHKNGFYIEESQFLLRPEVIESAFYGWRLTGDPKYQEFVWDAFNSIQKYCKASSSFSAIADVDKLPVQFLDRAESFFFAETFKYIYLTFSAPEVLSLDQYVFNTEAHPFRYHPRK